MTGIPPDAEIAARHESGAPSLIVLRSDATIEGVPCRAGPIVLHENSTVAQARLASIWKSGDHALEPDDLVILRADGSLEGVWLAHTRTFVGVDAIDAVFFEPDGSVEQVVMGDRGFDLDGRLRSRRLSAPETIDGLPCGPASRVRFHANGRLAHAELGGPFASPHGLLPRGTLVAVDDRGRMTRAYLREPAALGGRPFSADTAVRFGADGPMRDSGWTFYTPDPPRR